ncbi:MAG: hypothetical protein KJ968_00745 [Nanoarchaeota archaeon]|nr:hypothetical protein [Nanoarchaeota archaeon]MBU4283612.1 hypothetical protein [Nanoarchaeota archaeon]
MAKKKKRKNSKPKKAVKRIPIAPPPKKQKSSKAKFLIAVLAVLVIIFFVSAFYNKYKMNSEAEKIIDFIVVGDEVNEQALNSFMSTDYNELKKELGITKNFLVYFEDEDETIIPVNGIYCFGSKKATLNGMNCG